MADSISKCLFYNLKSFFKKEELSDKTLKIIESHTQLCRKRKISDLKEEEEILPEPKALKTVQQDNNIPVEVLGNGDDLTMAKSVEVLQTDVCATTPTEQSESLSVADTEETSNHGPESEKNAPLDKKSKEKDRSVVDMIDADQSFFIAEQTETIYTTFPVHSIVLCLHSEFFQKMLTESRMRETSSNIIELKVPLGEGKNLELLISSFYDEKVIDSIKSINDLLKLMEMAERYCCTSFIEKGLDLLSHFSIFTVEDCNLILERCYHFRTFLNIPNTLEDTTSASVNTNLYRKVEKQCVEFMEEQFSPLECNFKNALHLSYESLYILLRDAKKLAFSEDTVLITLYEWLRMNISDLNQSAQNIEKLLKCIRYQYCSKFFLTERLSLNDLILSKSHYYAEWLFNAISYHAVGEESRIKRGYPATKVPQRNINDAECSNNYIFTLTFPQDGMRCFDSGAFFVNAGYVYGIDVKVKHTTVQYVTYNVGIYPFEPSFEKLAANQEEIMDETITLAYALLPGDVFYDENVFQGEQFQLMKKYFRKYSVSLKRFSKYVRLPSIHAEVDFHENVKLQGLQVALIIGSSHKIIEKLHEIRHISSRPRLLLRSNDVFIPQLSTTDDRISSPDILLPL